MQTGNTQHIGRNDEASRSVKVTRRRRFFSWAGPAAILAAAVTLAVPAAHTFAGPGAKAAKTTKTAKGTLSGRIVFAGKPPALKPLDISSDPFCARSAASSKPVDDTVKVSKGGLENVVVRIVSDVKDAPQASGEVVLDQRGCVYEPRVAVAVAGQTVTVKNSDQTLHNVHTYKGPATLFNQAQPQGFPAIKKKFPKPGDAIRFSCDVHPWMKAWVFVTGSPYAAVSGTGGTFTIPDVPPGTYTVEAWHETLGTQTAKVTVKPGKPASLDFKFAP